MATFNLVFYGNVPYGGGVAYTVHLARALRACGHRVRILKHGKQAARAARPFYAEWSYQTINPEDLITLAHREPVILTVAWDGFMEQILAVLAEARVGIVLHDPNEFKAPILEMLIKRQLPPLTIRAMNAASLCHYGAHFVPHPYTPGARRVDKTLHAVSLARVDWDKHTEIVCAANRLLEPARRVRIYGQENRIFTYHKLRVEYPEWRLNYFGSFKCEGVRLAEQARYVVDMSAIKNDGGGTQYTFFEAWDADAILVISAKWLTGQDRSLEPGRHFVTVNDAGELAALLRADAVDPAPLRAGAAEVLARHSPAEIVPGILNYMEAVTGERYC